jgi:hypothetical protein
MCLLFHEPGNPKPDEQLATCFDPYFAIFKPTVQKILIVQPEFGWTTFILPNISLHFHPIIPLLEFIQHEFILSIKTGSNGGFQSNPEFWHDAFLSAIIRALAKLPPTHWEAQNDSRALVSGCMIQSQESLLSRSSESTSMSIASYAPQHIQVATTSSTASVPPAKRDQLPSAIHPKSKMFPQLDSDDPEAALPLPMSNVLDRFDSPGAGSSSTIPFTLPALTDDSPSSEFLPCPGLVRRLGKSSGSASNSRGINKSFSQQSKSSSAKHGATSELSNQAESCPSKKRQKSNPRPDNQPGGVPRYQERSQMSRLHGHTMPF